MGRFALVASMLAGCFSPTPPTGAPCPTGVCPTGLECSAKTQTCEEPGSDPLIDAAIMFDPEAGPDAPPDARACFGSGFFSICPSAPPTQPIAFANSTVIDTDTSATCAAYTGQPQDDFCLIAGTTITISRNLRATGSRRLVLFATESITVNAQGGAVDVSSQQGLGAGANATACSAPTTATGVEGGAGGSFGGTGGRGADVADPNGPTADAPTVTPVMELRGGCRGGNGVGQQTISGGDGGGAVIFIALSSITINGTVNASGAGGSGAIDRSGGGGGGSGGMIVFDAPSVTVAMSGRILANGGGGGEGGTVNQDGNNGANPSQPNAGANGGAGGAPKGGDGGAGAAGATRSGGAAAAAEQCGSGGGGGGGGGGSAGIVRIFAAQQTIAPNTISPAPN